MAARQAAQRGRISSVAARIGGIQSRMRAARALFAVQMERLRHPKISRLSWSTLKTGDPGVRAGLFGWM